jgi:translocation protein SEC62
VHKEDISGPILQSPAQGTSTSGAQVGEGGQAKQRIMAASVEEDEDE